MKTSKIIIVALLTLFACTTNVQAKGVVSKMKNSAVVGLGWELGKQAGKKIVKVATDSTTKNLIVKKVKKVKQIVSDSTSTSTKEKK